MKNWKKLVSILLTALMVLGLCACGDQKETSDAAQEGSDVKAEVTDDGEYYMVTFQSGIDYWKGCYEGFEKAGQAKGLKTVYTGSTDGDFAGEVDVLEQIIAKKPAGIALTCVDPDALADVINKGVDAGIPIVTFFEKI